MIRRLFLLLTLIVVVFSAGCRTSLKFPSGVPYQTEFRVDDSALVAFPDYLTGQEYKVRTGGWWPWDKHIYIIPVDRAYTTEVLAHTKEFFRGGVTSTTRSVAAKLEETASRETTSTSSEIDRILEEMAGKREDPESTEKTEEELGEEMFEQAGIELLQQKDIQYIVDFHDAALFFNQGRLAVTFRTRLIDRRTGNILLDKRYYGQSRGFEAAQSEKTNEVALTGLTREAFNGSMKQLVYDMAVALDARGLDGSIRRQ